MANYRTFVQFDRYEAKLLRHTKKELDAQAKRKGEAHGLSIQEIIRGCVRTALHTVYGDAAVYDSLLDEDEFRRLCHRMEIDASQREEDP